MTTIAFVVLARDTGPAIFDLCRDIRTAARPGDRVVIVDDGGDPAQAVWSARFLAMEGFGPGIPTRRIVTGVRGAGDAGIAANIGLSALETRDAAAEEGHVLILPGGARLSPAGLAAARAQARPDRTLLMAAELVSPATGWRVTLPARDPRPLPGRLFIPRAVLQGPDALRAAEGRDEGGLIPLWRGALARGLPEFCETILGDLPRPPDPGPGWIAAARDAAEGDVEWIWAALAGMMAGGAPGAALALGPAIAALARDLPPPADSPLAHARSDAASAARAALFLMNTPLAAPAPVGRAPLRIARIGRHAHRMPPAYPAFAPGWSENLAEAPPDQADLLLFAHPFDLRDLDPDTARLIGQRRPTVALFSEEPFWDSLYSPDPLGARVVLRTGHLGGLALHQVNHHTSAIYAFGHLPYYPLTEYRFAAAYARLFPRNAALTPADWGEALSQRRQRVVFMAERRPEPFHDVTFPGGDIIGLCAWRTRLAEACRRGPVERLGASWQGGPTRFDLQDWHADKIAGLDGAAEMISAVENTHQPSYVSEKLFDAFACGARPLYVAGPGHMVHGLGLAEGSWINLHGLDSSAAAALVDAASPDADALSAYAAAQKELARRWTDAARIAAERQRIGRATLAEMQRIADLGPA